MRLFRAFGSALLKRAFSLDPPVSSPWPSWSAGAGSGSSESEAARQGSPISWVRMVAGVALAWETDAMSQLRLRVERDLLTPARRVCGERSWSSCARASAASRTLCTPDRLSTSDRCGIAPKPPSPFPGLMTNYPPIHVPSDAPERGHVDWLDQTSFPAQSAGFEEQPCEDVAVVRSVSTREPLGVFHAISTRDGEAHTRDGQDFYTLNPVDTQGAEEIAEIQFGDGSWMLATADDLEMTGINAPDHSR